MAVGATNRTGDEELEHLLSKPIKDHFFKLNEVDDSILSRICRQFYLQTAERKLPQKPNFCAVKYRERKISGYLCEHIFIFRAGAWYVKLLLDD